EVGADGSEIRVKSGEQALVRVKAAAMLDRFPDPKFHGLRYDEKPYWDVERARIPGTREVPVELIVNGRPVATRNLLADGLVREIEFSTPLEESSWIAVRILATSHTNPVFAIVDGKPIRASRRSAEWCLDAVNQCWTQKAPRIRAEDRAEARKAYDHAREVYKKLIAESP
ncbi:MAG: hypothetical protein GY953_14505, partial [bacterium]|nr:hypothetical protein [bacterium]